MDPATLSILGRWVLSAMAALQPPSSTTPTIAASYPATAAAIARAAEEAPLFAGPEGARETAALLLGVALHESSFRPWAVGDHGRSIGTFQIQPPTAELSADELFEPDTAARVAIRLLRQSMRMCRDRPLEERGGWFAQGGPSCDLSEEAARDSRAFFALAKRAMQVPAEGAPAARGGALTTFKPDTRTKCIEHPAMVAVVNKRPRLLFVDPRRTQPRPGEDPR